MADGQPWLPAHGRTGAALATGSQLIRDETARVAAAAGLELTITSTLAEARRSRPEVVLVGSDIAESRVDSDGELILVGLPGEEGTVWEVAARLHATRVALLPAAGDWLAERFARLRTTGSRGHILGLVGCSGGVGTSSLSCWLALASARSGRSTLLIDGDCGGGGLHLALPELSSGVRWEDLGEISGTLNPDQLSGALPVVRGFAVLSMSGSAAKEASIVTSSAVHSVFAAARSAFDVTVVDLPAGWPWGDPLLTFCDQVMLLVQGRTRPITAARSAVEHLQSFPTSVIARGPLEPGLDPYRVAELVEQPLMGYLPHLRGVPDAERQGRLLTIGAHRAVRRLTARILANGPAGIVRAAS
ncbi:septum site-determining protein Ssd [Arthrobacter sp. CAN_A1]|uniref:septum site-determining protein Ssd n=1 Tax=Arthrobacter sp. CAN_A1 TaxID=2787717 RepID=UPI0018CA6F4A